MRIIAGSHKGQIIQVPKALIEPTKESVKEALFNILGQDITNKSFLDLFSGSGNLGIEALSRGADQCTFVDNNRMCAEMIAKNLSRLKLEGKILGQDAFRFIKNSHTPFDYIFADPPYHGNLSESLLVSLSESPLLCPTSLIVVEHLAQKTIENIPSSLYCVDQRVYGITSLSFYTPRSPHSVNGK
ncbi:MAG TPA: 16S rRNA (guanine(966)-N(2))-methyltransferase RsmD, partial [Spirochaetes bacterium]|nr:16S rRNA (guanine(966)-N(2))-methyltransferase RsmD [Spirochaetota bacterium]